MKKFGICIVFLWMSLVVVRCRRRHHGVMGLGEETDVEHAHEEHKELVRGGTIGIIQDKLYGIELHHQDLEKWVDKLEEYKGRKRDVFDSEIAMEEAVDPNVYLNDFLHPNDENEAPAN